MKGTLKQIAAALSVMGLTICCCAAAHAGWGPEVRISAIQGQSWGPDIAASSTTLHAVWFEYPNFVDPEIYYSRSLDNGYSWSTPQNLSNNSGRPDLYPSVAADGNFVYVFWHSDPETGEAFFRRSTDGGVTWAAVQQLTSASGYSRASDVSVDSSGRVHLVWYDHRAGYSGIYYKASCDHGSTWTPDQWLTQNDGMVDNEDPRIVQGGDGNLYILFRSSRDGLPQGGWPPFSMYLLRSKSIGCSPVTAWLQPSQRVSGSLAEKYSNAHGGALEAGSDLALHLAYWDETAGNNVEYRRCEPAGQGCGAPVRLSSFPVTHPQPEPPNRVNPGLALDDSGGLHAFFSENAVIRDSLSVGRLFHRSSSDGGATWNDIEQLVGADTATWPRAAAGGGAVHLVWSDFRDNNYGSEIYYRKLDFTVGTGFSELVEHYYTSILKRTPDAGGLAYWNGEITRSNLLGIDVKEAYMVMADQFFKSAEYASFNRTNAEFVTDLYLTFFNRPPDSGGFNWWISQLNAGSSRDMVMYFFLFSPEFDEFMTGLYGDTSVRGEIYVVVDFYRGILGRLPDSEGFSYWLDLFRQAQCTGPSAVTAQVESITKQFFSSAEYVARNRTNAQYVQDLYYAFMRRFASPVEVEDWVNQLNTGAVTRDQLRQYFIQSGEFQARVNAMINEGCYQ